ncbi:MAG: PhnD/SsuA/transferrin family substrate-binding protein [Thermodesulfobacteriota bacterium]
MPFLDQAHGAEPVRIGVLAYRPKPQALAQWQPLASALKQAIPERNFIVEALTYPELDLAVASRQLDFVLTNPGHYVVLTRRSGLSSPLATVAVNDHGHVLTVYGGVIFSRADQTDITTLADIRGKTVASVDPESLAGYQVQAYELVHAGLRMPGDVTLLNTGMPHDKVVEAVLSRRAMVGFVRSGVLENMAREGKLDLTQIKVLNRQPTPDFPQLLSTRLYPEWPFAAMPHTEENLARRVAAALFLLEGNSAATQAMGIHGFIVPADYTPVEEMLRELRLPPYDLAPSFTLGDVWERYRIATISALLATALILFLGARLWAANRRLAAKQRLLMEQRQQILESEEKFRTVADYTYDWEIWEDQQGNCLYCSPSCQRITGYPAEAFMADHPGLLERLVHPDDLAVWRAHREAVHAESPPLAKKPPGQANELEFRILNANGEVRWINHICHHIRNETGRDLGHRISKRDITERKRMEIEAAKARNLEALGILAGGIAHDFNNLLYGIMGNLELAEMQLDPASEVYGYLRQAMQAQTQAANLTGRLIAFSPGGNMRPTLIVPRDHIREETLATLSGTNLRVEFDLAADLSPIRVDPSQFRNVIKHLVLNASEAMAAHPEGTLKITAANVTLPEHHGLHPDLAAGRYVTIAIKDQGCGISAENLPRIFDPYFSTKQRSTQKGMGLGLTLCDTIIRKHDGAITVESKPGQGTTFQLYLPVAAA